MRILIAPLDWGLGHATRCIPIIKYLLEKSCEVVIGADGRALHLLQKEFPACEFVKISGYDISYPKNGSMVLKMASQIPKIISGIKREHKLLKKIIKERKIDAVISDNRYGLWSREVPSVFITHQLIIKSPFGEKLIHKLNMKYISKYSECWIPDYAGDNNLSGDLSHKFSLPKNVKFIGVLSRFASPPAPLPLERGAQYKLLVILSGPEPQRTLFEKKIIEQLDSPPTPLPVRQAGLQKERGVLIVQGITEKSVLIKISENIEMISYLTAEELKKEICSSEIVLCRPGYSSVMDLAMLNKKVIFVPTPGQTEQEYLAKYFSDKKIAYSVSQKYFDLKVAIKESEKYSGFTGNYSGEEFKNVVDKFLLSLGRRSNFSK